MIWSTNILDDARARNCYFGLAASPLIADDLVIVSPGGKGASLVAYDALTGGMRWKAGDARASYSSPHRVELAGTEQILIFNAEGLYAHELKSGRVLWNVPWISNPSERNNVCQPVPVALPTGDGVFISSSYGKGCALLEVRREKKRFAVRQVWSNLNLKSKFASVVEKDGFVYGLDERILTCIDLTTGGRCWKAGRYGFGQLLLVDDLLLVLSENGEVALVDASPAGYREVAKFRALDGRTWGHPVLAGRYLIVRSEAEAACYELALVGGFE